MLSLPVKEEIGLVDHYPLIGGWRWSGFLRVKSLAIFAQEAVAFIVVLGASQVYMLMLLYLFKNYFIILIIL